VPAADAALQHEHARRRVDRGLPRIPVAREPRAQAAGGCAPIARALLAYEGTPRERQPCGCRATSEDSRATETQPPDACASGFPIVKGTQRRKPRAVGRALRARRWYTSGLRACGRTADVEPGSSLTRSGPPTTRRLRDRAPYAASISRFIRAFTKAKRDP